METRRTGRLPKATPHLTYMAESEGVCYFLMFSDQDVAEKGGKAKLEAALASEYEWIEFLGVLLQYQAQELHHYHLRDTDVERLVLRCSRRVVPLDSAMGIQYLPIDSAKSRNN